MRVCAQNQRKITTRKQVKTKYPAATVCENMQQSVSMNGVGDTGPTNKEQQEPEAQCRVNESQNAADT